MLLARVLCNPAKHAGAALTTLRRLRPQETRRGRQRQGTSKRGETTRTKKKKKKTPPPQVRHTFGSALRTVGLHGHVGIQVVQSAIGLFAPIPAALVHALNLFIASSGPLVLLRTGNRDEGIHLQIQDTSVQHVPDQSWRSTVAIPVTATAMQASSTPGALMCRDTAASKWK
jgi:hypothetical protein